MHTVADWANRLEWSFSLVEFIYLSVISSLNGLTRSWFCTHISFKCDYLSPKNEQEKNTATQTAKTEQRVNEKNIHHTQSTNVYFFFSPEKPFAVVEHQVKLYILVCVSGCIHSLSVHDVIWLFFVRVIWFAWMRRWWSSKWSSISLGDNLIRTSYALAVFCKHK